MHELRYTELKYNGETYTDQWKIDEILVKNKFNWMVNAEIKNARLEIFQDTLVWNGGIWYNGDWYFGVWRDGEWKYGTWQNGVFYNGTWRNGTFKSGIIYNGHFFKGKILAGEIRGGQFIDVEIDPKVIEYNNDEIIAKKEDQQEQQQKQVAQVQAQAPAQPDTVKVHSTQPASQQQNIVVQPKIQEKNNYIMKKIKKFESFVKEEFKINEGLLYYDSNLKIIGEPGITIDWLEHVCNPKHISNIIYNKYGDKIKYGLYVKISSNDVVIYTTYKIDNNNGYVEQVIDSMNLSDFETEFCNTNESVGDPMDSFIDINLDATELETYEDGKIEQEPGKIIIENPSKTDAYNAKMRLGGEITIDPKYPEKQIHHIKRFNDLK
jgi:hypothetical protein